MTLTVSARDFGPIIEGTVELKPLTVFVGPSNSGKSYLAMLIYSLMQSITRVTEYGGGLSIPAEMRFRPLRSARHILGTEGELSSAVKDAIDGWVQNFDDKDFSEIFVDFYSIPAEVQGIANEAVRDSLRASVVWFDGELQRCHGKISDLRRRSEGMSKLRIYLQQSSPFLKLSLGEDSDQEIGLLKMDFDVSYSKVRSEPYPRRELQRIKSRAINPRFSRRLESLYHDLLSTVSQDTQNYLFEDFPKSSYYLPAARSGIAQGHKAIASILVRQSSFAALQPLEIPTLSGVITDFISHILTMERGIRRHNLPGLEKEVAFLENEVVRGKIDIEERGTLPYPEISYEPFTGQPTVGNFPFHKTSSMVSELAPVILFLKHLVRTGDLLILEEPESHLHPAIQRMMARAIVRLVNAGVRVLITTHSDYFLNQLNNLMRIEDASDRWLEQAGFERADCLQHDAVNAYVFRWDAAQGGNRVEQLSIRRDVGIDDEEFGKVVNEQYEETIMVEGIQLK